MLNILLFMNILVIVLKDECLLLNNILRHLKYLAMNEQSFEFWRCIQHSKLYWCLVITNVTGFRDIKLMSHYDDQRGLIIHIFISNHQSMSGKLALIIWFCMYLHNAGHIRQYVLQNTSTWPIGSFWVTIQVTNMMKTDNERQSIIW